MYIINDLIAHQIPITLPMQRYELIYLDALSSKLRGMLG